MAGPYIGPSWAAVPTGKYRGKQFYRIPVRVVLSNSRALTSVEHWTYVIAPSATAAANYVRDACGLRPETEIRAYGPKGGEIRRYVGWESAIGNRLLERAPVQESLT